MGSYGKLSEAAKKIAKAGAVAAGTVAAVGAAMVLTDDEEADENE